jgi:hypothetical protein
MAPSRIKTPKRIAAGESSWHSVGTRYKTSWMRPWSFHPRAAPSIWTTHVRILELRRQVESLIASHDDAGGFLEEPAIAGHLSSWVNGQAENQKNEDEQAESWVGRRIGPYQFTASLESTS